MVIIRVKRDAKSGEIYVETNLTGKPLLTIPQLNKGTAYSDQETLDFWNKR